MDNDWTWVQSCKHRDKTLIRNEICFIDITHFQRSSKLLEISSNNRFWHREMPAFDLLLLLLLLLFLLLNGHGQVTRPQRRLSARILFPLLHRIIVGLVKIWNMGGVIARIVNVGQ